jgi:hypothetical protein
MAMAKVAAGHRSTTKAGCALALLLFAGFAAAQTTTPEAPAAAAESPARPAVPPKITYVGGQLRIDALGSTLAEVLTQVAALTGVNIEIPAGANSERMPVVELGPGPARQILASLLSDSNFDYLIQASDADPEKIQSVLLMPREKKGSGTNGSDAVARASRGPAAPAPPEVTAPDSPAPAPPEIPAPDASSLTEPAPAQPVQATPPVPMPPDLSGQPLLQPDTSNPAKPGALTPPAALTPQSINQQLQQMYQQRAQMTQQDHYTGTQPVLLPGAK